MSDASVSSDVIVRASGVSKRFSRSPEKARRPGLHDVVQAMLGYRPKRGDTRLREDEFWAVRNVTFDLHRGEALGIVGLNGAGKSTLLKILLGRLRPDIGVVSISGRAGGLIELGAGFHPEVSGRQNILIGASLLGVPESEVARQIDAIIAFADIGRFIDSPVKMYSSGMKVRLGFAVAVHFVPDVVICDEVLAVGDFEFRQKCLQRIKEIRRTRSVILVSHSTADIALFCNRAMLMHHGEMILIDAPEPVLKAYAVCTKHLSADEVRRRSEKVLARNRPGPPRNRDAAVLAAASQAESKRARSAERVSATGASMVEAAAEKSMGFRSRLATAPRLTESKIPDDEEMRIKLFGPKYTNPKVVRDVSVAWNLDRHEKGFFIISGEPLMVRMRFTLIAEVERLRIGLPIFDENGVMLLGPDSRFSADVKSITRPGAYTLTACIDPLPLNGGRYWPVFSICDDPAHLFRKHLPAFEVYCPNQEFGVVKVFSTWWPGDESSAEMTEVVDSGRSSP